MTSKSPVRSCDDLDEICLNYAEIKALCAGNPKIKLKMDLDIEVAKLKVLKGSYKANQYRLEDNITRIIPERIKYGEQCSTGFTSDLETLKSNIANMNDDTFKMTIDGINYDKKIDAGKAILSVCTRVKSLTCANVNSSVKTPDFIEVGEFCGFKLAVHYDYFSKISTLSIGGEMTQKVELGDDARGNITRIENILKSIEGKVDDTKDFVANQYQQLEAAVIELQKPFAKEDELKEKSQLLVELTAELSMQERIEESEELEEHEEVITTSSSSTERPSVLNKLKEYKPYTTSSNSHAKNKERDDAR